MVVFLVHHADLPEAALALARRLRWHDCTPTAVWTSPAPAAVMTATRLVEILEWQGPIERPDGLGPEHDEPGLVADRLTTLPADGAVVVVGHEPLLSRLGHRLAPAFAHRPLARGEALRIDDGEPRWWFAHDDDAPVRAPRVAP